MDFNWDTIKDFFSGIGDDIKELWGDFMDFCDEHYMYVIAGLALLVLILSVVGIIRSRKPEKRKNFVKYEDIDWKPKEKAGTEEPDTSGKPGRTLADLFDEEEKVEHSEKTEHKAKAEIPAETQEVKEIQEVQQVQGVQPAQKAQPVRQTQEAETAQEVQQSQEVRETQETRETSGGKEYSDMKDIPIVEVLHPTYVKATPEKEVLQSRIADSASEKLFKDESKTGSSAAFEKKKKKKECDKHLNERELGALAMAMGLPVEEVIRNYRTLSNDKIEDTSFGKFFNAQNGEAADASNADSKSVRKDTLKEAEKPAEERKPSAGTGKTEEKGILSGNEKSAEEKTAATAIEKAAGETKKPAGGDKPADDSRSTTGKTDSEHGKTPEIVYNESIGTSFSELMRSIRKKTEETPFKDPVIDETRNAEAGETFRGAEPGRTAGAEGNTVEEPGDKSERFIRRKFGPENMGTTRSGRVFTEDELMELIKD